MLLGTYQPLNPSAEHRNRLYDCFREKLDGEYPIFCFPARTADEFCFRSLLAAPCKAEKLVLFDTDNFVRFDAVEWNLVMMIQEFLGEDPENHEFEDRFNAMFESVDERFSEYVVKGSALDDVIDEIDLRDLIMAETFETAEEGVPREMFQGLQEVARCFYLRSVANDLNPEIDEDDRVKFDSLFLMGAFVHYLGAVAYHAMLGEPSTMLDAVPFIADPHDQSSIKAYETFQELRWSIFDSAYAAGSHEDYLLMAQALEDAIGKARLNALSKRFSRNDLCPCFSGKKFKKCHGAKPIDIFPF